MVRNIEDYPYSSHRVYMGLEPVGIVDVDPLLRRFGAKKAVARQRYSEHVAAGMKLGHLSTLYETRGGVLGTEEFVDSMIHRMGEFEPKGTPWVFEKREFSPNELISAVESICQVAREDFCGTSKMRRVITAKETLILAGRRLGLGVKTISDITGLSVATVGRRHDKAVDRLGQDGSLKELAGRVVNLMISHESRES